MRDRDRPSAQREHGDFATNVACSSQSAWQEAARGAEAIVKRCLPRDSTSRDEIAGPGSSTSRSSGRRFAVVRECSERRRIRPGQRRGDGRRIMVEFVSANPTGRCTWAMAAKAALAMRSPRSSNGRAGT
jgi:arginyl-tRNA synthetase